MPGWSLLVPACVATLLPSLEPAVLLAAATSMDGCSPDGGSEVIGDELTVTLSALVMSEASSGEMRPGSLDSLNKTNIPRALATLQKQHVYLIFSDTAISAMPC